MNQAANRPGASRGNTVRLRRHCGRILLLLCGALLATAARAEENAEQSFPQVWINPGIYSYHFDRDKDLRNNNVGIGAEVRLATDHGLMVGNFINSNSQRSHYATYQWRPLHWQWQGLDLGAGIVVGGFDGYPNYRNGGWFLAPLPMLMIEGKRFGANLSVIPTVENRFDGAIAIQVKMRIW